MKKNPNLPTSKPRIILASGLCLFGLWLAVAGFHATARLTRNVTPPAVGTNLHYGKLPLSFEPNAGQLDPAVKFLARGPGYGIYLTTGGAVLSLQKGGSLAANQQPLSGRPARSQSRQAISLHMTLVDANHDAKVSGVKELAGKAITSSATIRTSDALTCRPMPR